VSVWRSALAAALLVGVPTAPPANAAVDQPAPSRTLFTIADEDVFESSGLVDDDRTVYTVNDSGDDAVVYGIDPGSGETVSRTTYADSVDDVEAVAPGAGGTVWVGDIGDNRERREDLTAFRVTPGRGDAPRFTLGYPDGARDAETLLVHPRTGRLFVVSKSAFGGTVYAAPPDLRTEGTNRLRAFARVAGLVTDGSFFPDGRHVVLRTYGTASVYAFPGFELTGTVRLPAQRQGEGISVSPSGRVLVSSEGVHADVLEVTLPRTFTAAAAATRPPGPEPSTRPPAHRPARATPAPRGPEDYVAIALVAGGLAFLGWLTLRNSRVQPPPRPAGRPRRSRGRRPPAGRR
jgi:hypothetical protein